MKAGRGHVCKIENPTVVDQTSVEVRHVAIGPRSLLFAEDPTRWRLHMFPSFCFFYFPVLLSLNLCPGLTMLCRLPLPVSPPSSLRSATPSLSAPKRLVARRPSQHKLEAATYPSCYTLLWFIHTQYTHAIDVQSVESERSRDATIALVFKKYMFQYREWIRMGILWWRVVVPSRRLCCLCVQSDRALVEPALASDEGILAGDVRPSCPSWVAPLLPLTPRRQLGHRLWAWHRRHPWDKYLFRADRGTQPVVLTKCYACALSLRTCGDLQP